MNSPKWDNYLKNVAKKTFNEANIPLPDKRETWDSIQMELEKEQQIENRKNTVKKYSGLLPAASILFFVFLLSPTGSSAFSSMVSIVNQWKDNVVKLVVHTDSGNEGAALTPPPGEESSFIATEEEILLETQIKEVTLDEAKSMLTFTAVFPPDKILFDTYKIERVRVWTNSEKTSADKLELAYSNGEMWFSILQEKIPEHFIRSIEYNLDHAEMKEVMIGRHPGNLIVSNNIVNLEYVLGDNYITIFGGVSEEEVLELANRLK